MNQENSWDLNIDQNNHDNHFEPNGAWSIGDHNSTLDSICAE